MSEGPGDVTAVWEDAVLAAVMFALDPAGTGGVALRALPGPVRDLWLGVLARLLPTPSPVLRVPVHVTDGRLLGGLDLGATLRAGRPVAERGLLSDADGGVVQLAMAERVPASTCAHLIAAMDAGEVVLERDGIAARTPSRFGVVALDEGIAEDERMPFALLDRLAFHLDLAGIGIRDAAEPPCPGEDLLLARSRLPSVRAGDEAVESICAAALALGVDSLRGSLLAVRAARVSAALAGRAEVGEEDIAAAARLVLAPRATRLPAAESSDESEEDQPEQGADEPREPDSPPEDPAGEDQAGGQDRPLEEMVLEAARSAIPKDLLERLGEGMARRNRARAPGKAGTFQHASLRGRPIGTRRGEPAPGVRLNVVETLRAAAPWQRIRRGGPPAAAGKRNRVEVRRDDFRVTRFKQRAETTTIFVVDASGSSALHRLAEAKGAVELMLASCYVRRDRVALVAFRGKGAELLLPPTRSLVRAKRSLASLPGGGGTPLAAGIDVAMVLADGVRRRGGTPTVVLMTDGRANVARDGAGGRARAAEEALSAARAGGLAQVKSLLVDTSPHPQPRAKEIAEAMGALYLPLPYADATALSEAVQAAAG
jgi:magnesium chelatase subunit D